MRFFLWALCCLFVVLPSVSQAMDCASAASYLQADSPDRAYYEAIKDILDGRDTKAKVAFTVLAEACGGNEIAIKSKAKLKELEGEQAATTQLNEPDFNKYQGSVVAFETTQGSFYIEVDNEAGHQVGVPFFLKAIREGWFNGTIFSHNTRSHDYRSQMKGFVVMNILDPKILSAGRYMPGDEGKYKTIEYKYQSERIKLNSDNGSFYRFGKGEVYMSVVASGFRGAAIPEILISPIDSESITKKGKPFYLAMLKIGKVIYGDSVVDSIYKMETGELSIYQGSTVVRKLTPPKPEVQILNTRIVKQ